VIFVVVKVDVWSVLVARLFVMAVWNVVMGAEITKGFGVWKRPFWNVSVLAEREDVLREEVCMAPCELSMVAVVKLSVLTLGEQIILRPTWRVLT
jgi:hypothetical protein